MGSRKVGILLLFVLLGSLCGCGKNGVENPTEPVGVQTQVPQENRVQHSPMLSSQSDGYYTISSGCLFYYDFPTRKTLSLCPQAGCEHKDATCQAWVGSIINSDGYKEGGFLEYHGDIYASVIPRPGCVEFVKYEISSGKRTVMASWDSHDNVSYRLGLGRFSEGYGVLALYDETVITNSQGIPERNEVCTSILVDLATGEQKPCPDGTAMYTRNYGFSIYHYTDEELGLMTLEEFQEQHPELSEKESSSAYWKYKREHRRAELRLHDRSNGSYTVIADTLRDGYVQYSDLFFMKGYHVLFVCGDEVRVLDMATGQVRVLLEMPNVINYWLCDGKAFLITRDEKETQVWYAGLEDGVAHQLPNQGNREYMVFGMYDETPNYFIGVYQGGEYVIRKDDFYADRYENAFQVG